MINREQALEIGRQLNSTVYPEMMKNIFQLAKGELTLPLMTDVVKYLNMLSDLPRVLGPDEDFKTGSLLQEFVLYIEEHQDRVFKLISCISKDPPSDDGVVCFKLRNSMFALDGILRTFFKYADEKFPAEKNDQKQEVQEDGEENAEEDQ